MIIVYIEWTFGLLNNTYISRDYYTNVHFSVNLLSLTNWLTLEYTQLIQEVIFLTVCWKKKLDIIRSANNYIIMISVYVYVRFKKNSYVLLLNIP